MRVCTPVGIRDEIMMKKNYLPYLKLVVCLLCLSLVGCASLQKHQPVKDLKTKTTSPKTYTSGIDAGILFEISSVAIHPKSFNPVKGETTTISFHLSKPAKAMIQIFDPDNQLVRELVTDDTGDPGKIKITWDGKDMDGAIVPDEAYFFTIEANEYKGALTHYDPVTFSGGDNISVPVNYDKIKKVIDYELPQDTRIIIRGGITQGPMLKHFANWRPKPAGQNKDFWNGKDDSNAIRIDDKKGFVIMSEGVTLPENSIITFGNNDYSYPEYKSEKTMDRPLKEVRPKVVPKKSQQNMQFVRPAHKGVSIKFRMQLPQGLETNSDNIPIVKGKVPVKIIIDDEVKRFVTEQRYEIINYVDFQFISEQEEGYSPCTWLWDSNSVRNGEHILTVNIATLTGNLASGSLKVFVSN